MQRFKRILVVLEAAEPAGNARQELLEFARANAATVTVAACCEIPEPSLVAALFDGRDHQHALRAQLEASAAAFSEPLRAAGIDVDSEMIEGDALDGICRLARSARFDLVAKFAEGNTPDTPFTFGPLDRGLMRMCPLPVLITNPHKEEKPRVLVAIDAMRAAHALLNVELLEIGAGQAAAMKAELHVVNAWRLVGETALRSGAFTEVSAGKLEQLKYIERGKRHAAIEGLLAPLREQGLEIVEHIVEGPPPKAIAAVAQATDADLIVMGARQKSLLGRLFSADDAQATLRRSTRPLLIIPEAAERAGESTSSETDPPAAPPADT
jgi:nucleotide-binding universal stress UspA family protein